MITASPEEVVFRYQCRHRPGLKLYSPESCEKYKAGMKTNPMAPSPSQANLCLEWECTGPIEIPSEKPMDGVWEMPPKRNKSYAPPSTCRTCGLAVGSIREDGSDVRFYPSRPEECIRCIEERKRSRKEKASWAPIEGANQEMATDLAQNVYPLVEAPRPYVCEIHGPHAGYTTGGRFTKQCPECGNRKRLDGMAAHNARMAAMARIMKRYPFLMTYLEESAARGGNESAYDAMAQIVIESIPPEWFKAWALRGVTK